MTSNDARATGSQKTLGQVLRAAREAQGLGVADVAQRTKFSVHQVEALEADDGARLPQGTFLRGFVRSYARVLGQDENGFLAYIPVRADAVAETAFVQPVGKVLPLGEGTPKSNVYLFAGALAVMFLLVAFVWNYRDEATLPATVVEEIRLPPTVEASGSVATTADTELPAAAASKQAQAELPPAKVESAAAPVQAAKQDVALEALKKRPIHIVFSEETWMEIIDTHGEVLLSRTNPAGSEKWIGGGRRAPYEITIGKVRAVKITYKGREVDLSQFTPDQGVELVLE